MTIYGIVQLVVGRKTAKETLQSHSPHTRLHINAATSEPTVKQMWGFWLARLWGKMVPNRNSVFISRDFAPPNEQHPLNPRGCISIKISVLCHEKKDPRGSFWFLGVRVLCYDEGFMRLSCQFLARFEVAFLLIIRFSIAIWCEKPFEKNKELTWVDNLPEKFNSARNWARSDIVGYYMQRMW